MENLKIKNRRGGMIKNIVLVVVLGISMTGCIGSIFTSSAIKSCTKCYTDVQEELAASESEDRLDTFLRGQGVKVDE